jgi:DNA polymerase elongation subunit (family B)
MRKTHKMKVLYLDIETAPTLVYSWSLWPKYIDPNNVQEAGYTLCWAAQWEGERNVEFGSIRKGENEMLARIHALLDEADAVVHYNGTKFDIPVLFREFVRAGLHPPSHFHQIDLLKTVRKQFRFESNKLDYVCQRLGLGGKVKHKGMSLWFGVMEGREQEAVQAPVAMDSQPPQCRYVHGRPEPSGVYYLWFAERSEEGYAV